MAFALALKSNHDFPTKGKKFLTLTLSLAMFTLLMSNTFLHYLLKKLGFNYSVNTEIRLNESNLIDENDENKFVKTKRYLLFLHEKYLLPLIIKESDEQNESKNENNDNNDNHDKIILKKVNENDIYKIETELDSKEDKRKSFDS